MAKPLRREGRALTNLKARISSARKESAIFSTCATATDIVIGQGAESFLSASSSGLQDSCAIPIGKAGTAASLNGSRQQSTPSDTVAFTENGRHATTARLPESKTMNSESLKTKSYPRISIRRYRISASTRKGSWRISEARKRNTPDHFS